MARLLASRGGNGWIVINNETEFRNGEPSSEPHEPFNPALEEFIERIKEDLCEGLDMSREELFEPPHNLTIEYNGQIYFTTRVQGNFTWHQFIKQHPMDVHYPHQCHQCEKPLKWSELLLRNARSNFMNDIDFHEYYKYEAYKRLKQWWRSKFVEFLCCSCYTTATQKPPLSLRPAITRSGDLTLC